MPVRRSSWQVARARTRQPYLPKLVVLPEAPCVICHHLRSSHSPHILQGRCKADGCDCPLFEPMCGCGHLLDSHSWGTAPRYYACDRCICRHFGARMTLP
jgi:hypothetical protein